VSFSEKVTFVATIAARESTIVPRVHRLGVPSFGAVVVLMCSIQRTTMTLFCLLREKVKLSANHKTGFKIRIHLVSNKASRLPQKVTPIF
jgi:hypothetical protein